MAMHVECTGKMRNEYDNLIRKRNGKRAARRPKCNWEDNIKKHLRKNRLWGNGLD